MSRGGGGVGGILAMGAGAFLILLAYTGKLQNVWSAAFGNPLDILGGQPDTSTGPGGVVGLDPEKSTGGCNPPAGFGTTAHYQPGVGQAAGGDAVFTPCNDGLCPAGTFAVVQGGGKIMCTDEAHYQAAYTIGWTRGGAGGQAFAHVTPWPMGGWHVGVSPSSGGFAA